MSRTATEKQIAYLKSLFTEAQQKAETVEQQGLADLLARITERITAVQETLVLALGGGEVPMADASKAIDTLRSVNSDVTRVLSTSAHPGLARYNAEKVIPNRYAKTCYVCAASVDAGDGYAVLSGRNWLTFCTPCANETTEEREARLAAERAERLAAQEAERAARAKALAEEQARRAYVEAFAIDLFDRAGVADQVKPDVHVAIPSATGNNDLDFFRVVRQSRTTTVYRVIGGHNDQRVSLAQAEAALLALVLTEDIPEALATYGRELGRCGVCHRHLTDEDSRARGIGPNCAARLGW